MADVAKVIDIIKNNFSYGIRPDYIDTGKVARLYSEKYSDDSISREFISEIIHNEGIPYGSIFYFFSQKSTAEILHFFNNILQNNSIAYYSIIFQEHSRFFIQWHIGSIEILVKFLQRIKSRNFFSWEFCSANKVTSLAHEIFKLFVESERSLSFEDISQKLQYVPPEKIRVELEDTKQYLPTLNGRYILRSKIEFNRTEILEVQKQISEDIDLKGYAYLEDYEFPANMFINSEIADSQLYDLIYENFLSVNFIKRGNKIYKKQNFQPRSSESPSVVLRKFINKKDELSLAELLSFSENLKINNQNALKIAYEKMCRVNSHLLVKKSLIKFNVSGVDESLSSFVQGKVISLKNVTSFTGFPSVEGSTWNLFLLESFLRNASRKYILVTPNINNSNIGAIHPISMIFKDYLSVQAAAVVQAKLKLEKKIVEDFLIEEGYINMRREKNINAIILQSGLVL